MRSGIKYALHIRIKSGDTMDWGTPIIVLPDCDHLPLGIDQEDQVLVGTAPEELKAIIFDLVTFDDSTVETPTGLCLYINNGWDVDGVDLDHAERDFALGRNHEQYSYRAIELVPTSNGTITVRHNPGKTRERTLIDFKLMPTE